MARRIYVCNLWPKLQIGKDVKFSGGMFETDKPDLQSLIEGNAAFGSSIHWQDTIAEMESASRQAEEETRNKKLRERERVLAEMKAEDEAAAEEKARREAAAQAKRDAAEQLKREKEAERRAVIEATAKQDAQAASGGNPAKIVELTNPAPQSPSEAIVAAQLAQKPGESKGT